MRRSVDLKYADIIKLWTPLALTWLMMAVEGPFLAAIVARLAEPKINLAAHGVAFSIAVIVEAPIIMLMSASTALVKNGETYRKLRDFSIFLNGGITLVMILGLATPGMDYLLQDLMELPAQVARLTHNGLIILLPWPAAIGFRRFYQGVLIAAGKTNRVAYGTIVRICSMSSTAVLLAFLSDLPGAYISATAMAVAVTVEAIATRIMAGTSISHMLLATDSTTTTSYRRIAAFYYPLALTSMIALAVHPMVSFSLGQSRLPVESLAVFPVVGAFVFLFRGTFGLSFQEISIALMKAHPAAYPRVRAFALILAGAATAIVVPVAFTPLSGLWFEDLSGLTPALAHLAGFPLMILCGMPALSVLLSQQRALLICAEHTGPITFATITEVTVTIGVLYVTIGPLQMVGADGAALALIVGRIACNLYLVLPCRNAARGLGTDTSPV